MTAKLKIDPAAPVPATLHAWLSQHEVELAHMPLLKAGATVEERLGERLTVAVLRPIINTIMDEFRAIGGQARYERDASGWPMIVFELPKVV